MKIARFVGRGGRPALGLVLEEEVVDLTRALLLYETARRGQTYGAATDPTDLMKRGLFSASGLAPVLKFIDAHNLRKPLSRPLDEVRLLAPIARPTKVLAIGLNYQAHAMESGGQVPEEPVFFRKESTAVIGPGDEVVIKPGVGRVDPEVELAVVIGQAGAGIPVEEVGGFVAGYTILNDVTARAMQRKDIGASHPWYRSKSLDTFCPIGPWIVLPDEIAEPVELDLEMRVNGEVRQSDNTRSLMWKIPELISFISSFIRLEPGDIVSTGTPEGMSEVKPGDVMEVYVERIGVLRNPVVAAE
ncbi:MAG: fumarylacetoacetate hydrolase family protein [Planctomycetes bacterium]|nr:fumarylacetoacetate hydrolase family protein [Planctomycetota bacterium]